MGRKPRVDRTPEEKWQIVQEGMKSGNVSETCRRYGIAQTLYYRWKDEAEQGAKAALGPNEAAEKLDFVPARAAWTYFKRLWSFGLLERRSRGRGTLEYRISELGKSRLRWLRSQKV